MRAPQGDPASDIDLADHAADLIGRLHARKPRVHCITNAVAQNFTANVLLAAGAIPSMTISPEEVAGFAARADALLVNLGTFDAERRAATEAALAQVAQEAKPWVLDPVLIDRLSLQPPTYEGPTGIVGVLHAACADAGMPSASLWAAVPHYVAVAPNPKGALAILRRLESLVGVTVDASDLETAAADYDRQVTRAVELDPEVQAFVERLERAADEEDAGGEDLPSGDVLAREFQRFLRQRGSGGPPLHASN